MARVEFAEEFECFKTFSTESQAVYTLSLLYLMSVNQPAHSLYKK